MDLNLKIPAIEKLLDYTASGIGSVAGPMLASWRAGKEANAKLIAARGDVEAQRILSEGQATTMEIIAAAQADARSKLVSQDSFVKGQLDLTNTVTQRVEFQEEKRQRNIDSVIRLAAAELESKDVEDHEPDHDWTARFFNDIQDVSSEEMQQLWGKVLAGEVERQGSTSIKTLGVLKNLDGRAAALFRTLCSLCVSISPDGNHFLDARVPSLGGNAGTNALDQYGLNFGNLNVLNEHGLIISDYNSWHDMQMSIGIQFADPAPHVLRIPFSFQRRHWLLNPLAQRKLGNEYRLSGVALTSTGQELSRIVELEAADKFVNNLIAFFLKDNLEMREAGSAEPQMISGAP